MNLEKWMRRWRRACVFCNLRLSAWVQKEPVYIYHHITKSGGMSVIDSLERWLVVRHDHSDKFYTGESDPEFENNPYDLSSFRTYECLCGHFGAEKIYLHQRYPAVARDPRS